MSTTYSTNLKLAESAVGDTGWGPLVNGNWNTLDALAPVGGLAVTTNEVPSASLNVAVAAGSYVKQDGTVGTYAGATGQAITASATKVLYLDLTNSGALTIGSSYPATPHIRLATVVAGSSIISSITDNRMTVQHAGERIPVLTHLLSTTTAAPSITAGAAAGTSPTVSVSTSSTDVDGMITVATGTSTTTGTMATIAFTVAFGTAPNAVMLTPANSAAAGLAGVYSNVSNLTTANFTIDAESSPSASTTYKWYYAVLG